jgi:hypothetical protein
MTCFFWTVIIEKFYFPILIFTVLPGWPNSKTISHNTKKNPKIPQIFPKILKIPLKSLKFLKNPTNPKKV